MKFKFRNIPAVVNYIAFFAAISFFSANLIAMLGGVVSLSQVVPYPEEEIKSSLIGEKSKALEGAFKQVVNQAVKERVLKPKKDVSMPETELSTFPGDDLEKNAKQNREELVSLMQAGRKNLGGSFTESVQAREHLLDLALQVGEGPVEEYSEDTLRAATLVLSTPFPNGDSEDPKIKNRKNQVLLRAQSVLLSMSKNPDAVKEVTLTVLGHEQDPDLKEFLARQLEAQYPGILGDRLLSSPKTPAPHN